ncbi:Emp65p KNAG_0G01550 [Huiozyma naganishii CBS 8797]|uniref:Uncharacterized protein n=1 Tax=Huiozyma naganishii (strain ATCC MYA-139 / BCRC 22969 / CBS 8797 / KCTC 17520 / NBRC 10181 / NCYC 3082 / Yp74L-3) TaxID=1071383 RepID=J7RNQ8_HUIN7|nr:hypothetical protein KNAG_0G01550 [Kazachstania naganishii CBS 8797]CCK71213.1 hypothetical protein KNAG_0G01550 [Kazachstania naganishii CBS 8797]
MEKVHFQQKGTSQRSRTSSHASSHPSRTKRKRVNRRMRIWWRQVLRSLELSGKYFPEDSSDVSGEGQESQDGNYEMEQLINMVQIPLYLEKYMTYTLLVLLDGFLYYFSVLPIKIIIGYINIYRSRDMSYTWLARTLRERLTLFLILISSIILSKLDTSKVYHRIKRQNSMKLYMLFSVLEIGDTMLSSMGQSLLRVLLFSKKYCWRDSRFKQLILLALTTLYLVSHGYVLIYQAISLNVAVNSYNNALTALLLSMQFAEIKASLFKKFDKEGLFQLTISDMVQRFKVVLLLLIIALRNSSMAMMSSDLSFISIWNRISTLQGNTLSLCLWNPMVSVLGSAVLVDWIKHAYITKFNRIKPQIYDKFFYITYKDHTTSILQYQERLGLPLPSFVVLFLVIVTPALYRVIKCKFVNDNTYQVVSLIQTMACIMTIACSVLLLRVAVHQILVYCSGHASRNPVSLQVTERDYVPGLVSEGSGTMDQSTREIIYGTAEPPPTTSEARAKHDRDSSTALEQVARYKMVSKRIW